MPNKDYVWSVSDENLGKIQSNGFLECDTHYGQIEVKVRDISTIILNFFYNILNFKETVNNSLSNFVNIVGPTQIELQIREFHENCWEVKRISLEHFKETEFQNIWHLVKNKVYYIRAFIFDTNRNMMLITPNIKIKVILIN